MEDSKPNSSCYFKSIMVKLETPSFNPFVNYQVCIRAILIKNNVKPHDWNPSLSERSLYSSFIRGVYCKTGFDSCRLMIWRDFAFTSIWILEILL